MNEGWIKLHRQIQDNIIWTSEPFSRGQAWVDLLLLANHKRGVLYVRGNKVEVKRGQVGWSQKKLSERWKWSRGKVQRFLNDLENEHQIEQQKNTVTSLIAITNYEEFQDTDSKRTADGQQTEQQTDTNKNEKNVKNEIKEGIHPLCSDLKNVNSMKEPLTLSQGEALISEYGKDRVKDILLQMENYKPLVKKNLSANLTVRNWIKRDWPKQENQLTIYR